MEHRKKGYTLDLLFASSDLVKNLQFQDQLLKSDDHHEPSFFEVSSGEVAHLPHRVIELGYFRGNYEAVNNTMANTDWNELFHDLSVDPSIDKFYEVLNKAISDFIPRKRVFSGSYPRWYSSELKHFIYEKKI
ncbi:hypothetical protein, partial [Enterobacter cloacae complex sp. 4DZ1-17B1]|uniref:hypothetical protein n=1 Tax=Enterobacter cloacae complex sp. 4DZ1-17B1 TaxID=2511991 RepID=UPI0013EBF413